MPRSLLILALLCFSGSGLASSSSMRVLPDHRMTIEVTATERNQLLTEMREFLHGLHNIQLALAKQDMKTVAVIAKPMGPLLERITAGLREKLPEQFQELAIAQNEAFQNLARIAENKRDIGAALEQTAEIMTYCSGCHDSFRFEVKTPAKVRR
jgi:hypothetical protein